MAPHTADDAISRRAAFERDGFVLVDELVDADTVARLNARLERVLRGDYDLGRAPHRSPKPGGGKLAQRSKRTVHVVDASRADAAFAAVVRSPKLAALAAELGGWPHGARVANDQVWAKPPGCGGLVFHRDSPYFDEILPRSVDGGACAVITIWLALDDMRDDARGPLRYARGSHAWGDGRRGSAKVFFAPDAAEQHALLRAAARAEGLDPDGIDFATAAVPAGGAGIHDGRCWHGSGPNLTDGPRRGLGVHFVPAVSAFDALSLFPRDARGALWRRESRSVALPEAGVWLAPGAADAYAHRCAAADAALADRGARRLEAAALACPRLFAGLDGASRRALAATSRAAAAACFARGTRWWRRRRGS